MMHLLTAQSLTAGDRHSMLTATTETNIPAYAFIPANSMPVGDSTTAREPCVEIHWRFWAFMNTAAGTGGLNTDTVTLRLYCGPTPGDIGTATAMWTTPPAFVLDRTAGTLQAVTFDLSAVTQRTPSTTIYGYHRAQFTASPNATIGSPVLQNWSWVPGAQADTLIGLRDAPYYMWLTSQFNSNLAVGGFFDVRSTVVKAYGLRIQD